jgi:hypothetical protein
VPNGFNPFIAGAMQTAAVSEKVRCWQCRGTGSYVPQTEEEGAEFMDNGRNTGGKTYR